MGMEAGRRPPTGRDTSIGDGDRRCRQPIANGNGEVKHGAVRGSVATGSRTRRLPSVGEGGRWRVATSRAVVKKMGK
jgi:hypothetical protein